MWKNIKSTCFFISYSGNSCYEIFLTDYLSIWCAYLPSSKFLHCIKESNPLLEMREDIMFQKALEILSKPNDIKNADIKVDNAVLILTMTKQYGYLFKLILKLAEGSKELFFQKITRPIVQVVQELKDTQLELCELLVRKDKEIKKLRKTGQTHAHEETGEFKADTFLSTCTKFRNCFGSETIASFVLEKIVTPPEDLNKLEHESDNSVNDVKPNIKSEPISQTMEVNSYDKNDTTFMKTEPEHNIKRETTTYSPKSKKRLKKLNL